MNILMMLQIKCAVAAATGDHAMWGQAHRQFEIIMTAKEVKCE